MNRKMKKTAVLVTLATMTIALAVPFLSQSVVAAPTIKSAIRMVEGAETLTFSTAETGYLQFFGDNGHDTEGMLKMNQRYEVTFSGSGQLACFHNNSMETTDVVTIRDGLIPPFAGKKNRVILQSDYFQMRSEDKSLIATFVPVDLDFSTLESALKEAEKLTESDYTSQSYRALETEINHGKFLLDANFDYRNQSEIPAQASKILEAIENLVKKDTSSSSESSESSSTEESTESSSTESSSSTEESTESSSETETSDSSSESSEENDLRVVGDYRSNQLAHSYAQIFFDSEKYELSFVAYGKYHEEFENIKIKKDQKKVEINGEVYKLVWDNNTLKLVEEIKQVYHFQDSFINNNLAKYPVYINEFDNLEGIWSEDIKETRLTDYQFLDIKNMQDEEFDAIYDRNNQSVKEEVDLVENAMQFNFTDTTVNIEFLEFGFISRTLVQYRNLQLPEEFQSTAIFESLKGKTESSYTIQKGKYGGHDLLVTYFTFNSDGTLNISFDWKTVSEKSPRAVTIKFNMNTAGKPIPPENPPAPEPPVEQQIKTGSNLTNSFIFSAGAIFLIAGIVVMKRFKV